MSNTIPARFKPYFWDVDFNDLSLTETPDFVLKRVLDLGHIDDVKWARDRFSDQDISRLIISSRDLSKKTINFWSKYLCLNKPSSQTPSMQ